jgi:hypothetical protein
MASEQQQVQRGHDSQLNHERSLELRKTITDDGATI